MFTRNEIIEICKSGSEAVIVVIENLQTTIDQQAKRLKLQENIIAELRRQEKLQQEHENLCVKLSEQMERIESQLKLLYPKIDQT